MINREPIKLVALDLDGTTLNDYEQLSPRTQKAFKDAMEKGVEIVIATGRTFNALPSEITSFKGLNYVLTSNGANLTHLPSGELLYSNLIAEKSALAAIELLRNFDYMLEVFVHGQAYIDKKDFDEVCMGRCPYRNVDYVIKTRKPVEGLLDFASKHSSEIENINVNFYDTREKPQMWRILSKLPGVTITSSFNHNIEIGGASTGKGDGVKYLCSLLNLPLSGVMACGDNPNDISMLEVAGLGIAVGNAHSLVKEVAHHVVATNQEDGVAEAIERFVL